MNWFINRYFRNGNEPVPIHHVKEPDEGDENTFDEKKLYSKGLYFFNVVVLVIAVLLIIKATYSQLFGIGNVADELYLLIVLLSYISGRISVPN